MDKELLRCRDIIRDSTKVIVFTDFDFDGNCCYIISEASLIRMNKPYEMIMSNNVEGRRGLNEVVYEKIVNAYIEGAILLTADTGSSESEIYSKLKEDCPGIKICVTDHHEFDNEEGLESVTDCIVNAMYSKSELNKAYCGANVVYEVFRGMVDIKDMVGYVGIANLIDQMDMSDEENRNTYRKSYQVWQEYDIVKWVLADSRLVLPHDRFIGMRLGPIINSCHRLGKPMVGVEALRGNRSAYKEAVGLNAKRKKLTSRLYEYLLPQVKANKNIKDDLMVVMSFGSEMKPYCGLTAGRIANELNVPTIVLNRNEYNELSGSMRSVGEFDFKKAINEVMGLEAMGHKAAAGVKIPDGTNIMESIQKFITWRKDNGVVYDTEIEAEDISLSDIDKYAVIVDKGRPYGQRKPYPMYRSTGEITKFVFSKRGAITVLEVDGIKTVTFKDTKVSVGDRIEMIYSLDIDLSVGIVADEIKIIGD